jgi:hypothetical protein
MANTAKFSIFYKARVVRTIVTLPSLRIGALGVTSLGQSPTAPVTGTLTVSPGASTLGLITHGAIPFNDLPTVYNTTGAQTSNSAASDQLTIPAGRIVHYVGLIDSQGPELYTYVALTSPDTNYYYEEIGTLTIPSGGYTIRHA